MVVNAEQANLCVQVVLAYRDRQYVETHTLAAGSSVGDLLQIAGILTRVAQGDRSELSLAIYGRKALPQTLLSDGDRVEILRPLTVDPKRARQRRAQLKSAQ